MDGVSVRISEAASRIILVVSLSDHHPSHPDRPYLASSRDLLGRHPRLSHRTIGYHNRLTEISSNSLLHVGLPNCEHLCVW